MDRVVIPSKETGADMPVEEGKEQATQNPNVTNVQVTDLNNQASPSPDRPNWLPEKFKNAEDLAKAYAELEKKLGNHGEDQSQNNQDNPQDSKQEQPYQPSQEEAKAYQAWENQFSTFAQEFGEKGQLSKDSYDKLTKMGYPRQVVDAYIQGQMALVDRGTQAIMSEIGGQEGFKEMHDWASQSLTQDEIDSYNAILETGSQQQASFAVKGMYARFKSANGKTPKLIGGTQSQSAGTSFRSVAEVTRAMSDPRYKTDSAYRKDVERKLANSDVL